MIPELEDGVLPVGIHSCTIEDIEQVFGKFTRTDKRQRLTEKLREYINDARETGIAAAIIIDGSYITNKSEPSDIDLILVLKSDFDLSQESKPFEERIQAKRMVKHLFGFDVLVVKENSDAFQEYVGLFTKVRKDDPEQKTSRSRKGLLRIEL